MGAAEGSRLHEARETRREGGLDALAQGTGREEGGRPSPPCWQSRRRSWPRPASGLSPLLSTAGISQKNQCLTQRLPEGRGHHMATRASPASVNTPARTEVLAEVPGGLGAQTQAELQSCCARLRRGRRGPILLGSDCHPGHLSRLGMVSSWEAGAGAEAHWVSVEGCGSSRQREKLRLVGPGACPAPGGPFLV